MPFCYAGILHKISPKTLRDVWSFGDEPRFILPWTVIGTETLIPDKKPGRRQVGRLAWVHSLRGPVHHCREKHSVKGVRGMLLLCPQQEIRKRGPLVFSLLISFSSLKPAPPHPPRPGMFPPTFRMGLPSLGKHICKHSWTQRVSKSSWDDSKG